MKYNLYDSNLKFKQNNLEQIPGKVINPQSIISNDSSWDLSQVSVFCTPAILLKDNTIRLYYSNVHIDGDNTRYYISVAESKNGIDWQKLELGQKFHNEQNTNLVIIKNIPQGCFCLQPSVIKLTEDYWQMFCWVHGKGICRYVLCESKDGLNWTALNFEKPCLYHPNDNALRKTGLDGLTGFGNSNANSHTSQRALGLQSNDATMTYYDHESQIYRMYSVWLFDNYPESGHYVSYDNAPQAYRVIQYRSSRNACDWSSPEIILTPDIEDNEDLQFYFLSASKIRNTYIGQLGNYNVVDRTIDTELVFSRNGIDWSRPLRNKPFLDRKIANKTAGMTMASHGLFKFGSDHLVFYNVSLHRHDNAGEVASEIMMGKIKGERFLGLRASKKTGEFLSNPFVLENPQIQIDAEVNGKLLAELCDPFGKPVKGFEFKDSEAFSGNKSNYNLQWKKQITKDMLYNSYRLKLAWNDGEVWGYEC